MRYRVELEELLGFVENLKLSNSAPRPSPLASMDKSPTLHARWSGEAAAAHRARHDEWITAAAQMREALSQLREAAHTAHRNYSEAVQLNIAMLS
jgi:uncharacterized protein YukE